MTLQWPFTSTKKNQQIYTTELCINVYIYYIYTTLIVHKTLKDCPLHQSLMDVLVLRHSQICNTTQTHWQTANKHILSLNKQCRYAHSSIIYICIHMIYEVGIYYFLLSLIKVQVHVWLTSWCSAGTLYILHACT